MSDFNLIHELTMLYLRKGNYFFIHLFTSYSRKYSIGFSSFLETLFSFSTLGRCLFHL